MKEIILNFIKERKNIIIFAIVAIILLLYGVLNKPEMNGDGYEYVGMMVSIKNHHSPNLLKSDLEERFQLAHLGVNVHQLKREVYESLNYAGYFKASNNKYYCWHFWFYSAICSVFLPIFHFLKINPLKVFQFTNCLLLILMFWWIWYKTTLSDKLKYYLTLITFVSPIWLYAKWTHPEVLTFVFLYIGLLEFVENRKITACLFCAIASLQNPGAILVPFFILLYDFVKKLKIDKELFLSGLVSLVGFIPYLFYYVHFGKLSLITGNSSSLDAVSFSKILSLFFDLNFGLILYIPVLLVGLFYACFRKNKMAITSVVVLLCIAFVDATQFNWNSGMNLVNRYSFWMIPIIIIGVLKLLDSLEWKQVKILFAIHVIVICYWLIYGQSDYNASHVIFNPVAKKVLNVAPALYNPETEVFAERLMGKEASFDDKLPLSYYYKGEIKKTLVKNEKTGKYKYINAKFDFKLRPVKIEHRGIIYVISWHGIIKTKRV